MVFLRLPRIYSKNWSKNDPESKQVPSAQIPPVFFQCSLNKRKNLQSLQALYKSGLPWFLWSPLQILSAFLTLIKLPWPFPVLHTSQAHSHFRAFALNVKEYLCLKYSSSGCLHRSLYHLLQFSSQVLCFPCGILGSLCIKLQAPSSLALMFTILVLFSFEAYHHPTYYRFYFAWVSECVCVCVSPYQPTGSLGRQEFLPF